jgi:pyruvate/2-oxoglutarate dehydrogenase complex dihydrolipoamide acyltransferase (E2) component
MSNSFELPDLGEGIHEAQIIQILVKEGDVVTADQPLMEVETDKAAVEIPSPQAGRIARIHVQAGQTVNVGSTLVSFGEAEGRSAAQAAPASGRAEAPKQERAAPAAPAQRKDEPEPAAGRSAAPAAAAKSKAGSGPAASPRAEAAPEAQTEDEPAPTAGGSSSKVAASPVVRRLAKEQGIDLAAISGSGPGGRITREDLEQATAGGQPRPAPSQARAAPAGAAPAPAASMPADSELPDFTKWGAIRTEAIPQIRKTIANHMVRSEATNVHVTHHDLADITMLEQLRKDHNARRSESDPKLTLLPFVMKAVYAAMRHYPVFNSSFDHKNGQIIYKQYFHFGVAVDTPRGLVVPVIRDVDRKSIRELAAELTGVGERARQASFTIEDLRGGTFTITNIGSLGGLVSTPIINYPEVAILGLGKADMRPVVRDGQIVARYILPLNLSFDHRVIDGADAARFCSEVMGFLEVPGRLLLED